MSKSVGERFQTIGLETKELVKLLIFRGAEVETPRDLLHWMMVKTGVRAFLRIFSKGK